MWGLRIAHSAPGGMSNRVGLMSWSIRTVPVAASMIDISMMRPSRSVVSVSRMTPTPGSRSCSGIQWVVIVWLLQGVSGLDSGAIPAP